MKSKNFERNYIKNEDIMPLIFEYRATGQISEQLGNALLVIATNYANKVVLANSDDT